VATFAIGEAGAANAALFAVAIMAVTDKAVAGKLTDFRRKQTEAVLKAPPLKL
jgi:5-(carboxyamino)imidazole ribonucleotide mutase